MAPRSLRLTQACAAPLRAGRGAQQSAARAAHPTHARAPAARHAAVRRGVGRSLAGRGSRGGWRPERRAGAARAAGGVALRSGAGRCAASSASFYWACASGTRASISASYVYDS